MSDSVDSTNPGGAAAGDAPPTKLSLREGDSVVTGVSTREEDLAHGPLLLGVGGGQEHPSIDPTWGTTENYAPQAEVLPLFPFRAPQPDLTEVVSASEPSHSGPSFAVPTQSVSHASNSRHEEVIQGLIDEPMPNRSLYWIPEFSWQDARLCFDDQPLELPATRGGQFSRGGPVSEHEFSISQRSFPRIGVPNVEHDEFQISDITGVGGFFSSNERQDERNFDQILEIKRAASSSSSDTSHSEAAFRGEFIDTSQPVQDEIAIQEIIKNIVEILADDYYRSYAPQRRTLAAKRKQVDRSSTSSTKNTRATIGRKGAKPTGRRGQTIDGDEGSEDEESGGSCVKKLRDIYRLKKHLQEKHFSHHCYICFNEFRPEDLTQHEKVCEKLFGHPTSPPPVGLITRDMATAINERSNTRLTSKEQWERLFKIIFPHEPIPLSPYLDDEWKVAHCCDYFEQPYVQCQTRKMMHESGLGDIRQAMPRLFEQLVVYLWDSLDIEHEIRPYVASEEETVDQAQHISTTEDYIPEESQTPALRGFEYDQDRLYAIQYSGLMEVDNTTTPAPEPFADQSETGVGEDLDRPGFIDNYGSSYLDIASNMNLEEVWSDPFSRPGAGDTPWYGGQEVFETGLDQMRGDETLFQ
ncbi:uncharacterized protein FTJAE_5616 [Fusarium tjaetaba]|uniref:C2H2-type domain-containing protein n=1 Tax=Fusarium tjaetaba TaxID=1567544 RepID=A0A8H5VVJ1_9HYPO|nr:uncharacterized protein FTJAE_5616 [Fusarium tjaetaba]KAF5637201.1 hypothetical protein FTJAE_5616 [Fusarium tjaetaba]